LASARLGDPGAEVVVDLMADGLDAGQVVEECLVVDLGPDRDAQRGCAGALGGDDEGAEVDLLVADEDARACDE
jgi:hypothetical protein